MIFAATHNSSSLRGGAVYKFITGERFVKPVHNLVCPAGDFLVWTGLQGPEDAGESMSASDLDMAALDGLNATADQIFRAARVFLRVLVGHINNHRELGTR